MRLLSKLASHGSRDSLHLHSQGGLGNQALMFLALWARARQLDVSLEVDLSLHQANRPFVLADVLAQLPGVVVTTEPRGTVYRKSVGRSCSVVQSDLGYRDDVATLMPGSCAIGYFQSWQYRESLSDLDLQLFRNAVLASGSVATVQAEVALHIRRGDYLQSGAREFHGILGPSYYQSAMRFLPVGESRGDVTVVAEGSIADVRSISGIPHFSNARIRTNGDVWSDLRILVESKSLICANSTFSFLAGLLGHPDRPVIVPSPWFANSDADRELQLWRPGTVTEVQHTFS